MQRCCLRARVMGYRVSLFSVLDYLGLLSLVFGTLQHYLLLQASGKSVLGKAGELQESVAKQDGEGKESCFSSELYYRHRSA